MFNTCRICKEIIRKDQMSVRHPTNCRITVHATCGIKKHGQVFVDTWCHEWQWPLLPALSLAEKGLLQYTEEKIKKHALPTRTG